jgi:hypothetical protein
MSSEFVSSAFTAQSMHLIGLEGGRRPVTSVPHWQQARVLTL